MDLTSIKSYLDQQVQQQGFSHYGMTPLQRPLTMDFYRQWIQDSNHGEMSFLKDHLGFKEIPQLRWDWARSCIIFAAPYFPVSSFSGQNGAENSFPKSTRISLYARSKDYHFWFVEKMNRIIQDLQIQFPDHQFLACTDSSPLMERDLAYRASMGWFGKNTCLIHPQKGSLFFLGEIITSIPLKKEQAPSPVHPDFCGKCTRCIDACPTQALDHHRKLDARKCISYWTIESKQIPPLNLREKIGDWFFGCDICQLVCPWNQKRFGEELKKHLPEPFKELEKATISQELLIKELREILEASNKSLERRFWGTPLHRARGWRLKRNALLVAGNMRLQPLEKDIMKWQGDPRLGELAHWALSKIFAR